MTDLEHAFISYARADGMNAAISVQSELEKSGFHVWRDLRDLDALADFSVEIERAINEAEFLVVCITASISKAQESFVRREILYAQSKKKPIIPLRIAGAEIPILIVHLTWLDVPSIESMTGKLALEIRRRLQRFGTKYQIGIKHRAGIVFVQALLDDIVTELEATIYVLLDLSTSGLSASKPMRGGLPTSMHRLALGKGSRKVTPGAIGQDLSDGYKRVILHGTAGSGKTTSLLIAAREAANAWLENNDRRLPVYCRAADWKAADNETLIEWLDRSTPLLPIHDLEKLLLSGKITLFIDGLNELATLATRCEVNDDGSEKRVVVDARAELLGIIPAQVAVLLTVRSEVLGELSCISDYELIEMEAITEDQIDSFVSQVPNLERLMSQEDYISEIVQTPLTLGLLAYVATHSGEMAGSSRETDRLSPRLRLIYGFMMNRWNHENISAIDLVPSEIIVGVLGRLATWWGIRYSLNEIEKTAMPENINAAAVSLAAVQLGFVRQLDQTTFEFFNRSFYECVATIHCWKYMGQQVSDGWDSRLYSRIEKLNDPAFGPSLIRLYSGFWRGEFGHEIAMALASVGDPEDPEVVRILINEAGPYLRLGHGNWIGRFIERGGADVRKIFIEALKSSASSSLESIHQLVMLGDSGIVALLEVYRHPDTSGAMREQILSYAEVCDLLGDNKLRQSRHSIRGHRIVDTE